jgi:hypothetical protein
VNLGLRDECHRLFTGRGRRGETTPTRVYLTIAGRIHPSPASSRFAKVAGAAMIARMRRTAAVAAFGLGAWLAVGCPPREARIEVTAGGVLTVTESCGCDGNAADCCLGARVSDLERFDIHLLVYDGEVPAVAASSACVSAVPLVLNGRTQSRDDQAAIINDAIDEALGDGGLGFDGLEDPADTVLVIALFAPSPTGPCAPDQLFACAGFGEPVPGADYYDVTCSSCRGGEKITGNAAPCKGECFIDECVALLGGTTSR